MLKKVFGNKKITKIIALAAAIAFTTSAAVAMAKSPAQTAAENEKENPAPQRIISLAPAGTEVLFAVGAGDKVVAVDEYSNYPEEAKALPKIGGFDGKTISVEKILSYEPDLLYLTKGMHDFLIPVCEEYGIQYYMSEGLSVDDVKKDIVQIGAITGNDKAASEAVAQLEEAEMRAAAHTKQDVAAPSVYFETWNSPYMTAGGNTFISDVIYKAGGYNVLKDLNDWPVVSEESIIAANPEVILIQKSAEAFGVTPESVAARPGWSDIAAVKNGKVFVVDDDLYSRPAPRIGQAIIELNELIQ